MKKRDIIKQEKLFRTLIRQIRKDLDMSQSELSDILKKPQSYISKYETGERRLTLVEVRIICIALGFPFSEFVRRFEEKLSGDQSSSVR